MRDAGKQRRPQEADMLSDVTESIQPPVTCYVSVLTVSGGELRLPAVEPNTKAGPFM